MTQRKLDTSRFRPISINIAEDWFLKNGISSYDLLKVLSKNISKFQLKHIFNLLKEQMERMFILEKLKRNSPTNENSMKVFSDVSLQTNCFHSLPLF